MSVELPMTGKVLLVDDEENVLQGYSRILRRKFSLDTATGGKEALERMESQGAYALVVSDMRMPGMDGVEFLSRVKDLYPHTTRIMLTGNADQATAISAVNRGAIFRFLNKPCEPDLLMVTIEIGLKQHELVTAEKQLVEQTLKGALRMLVELLDSLDPISFGRAQTVADLAERVARRLAIEDTWVLGIASVLGHIGILTVPDSVVTKMRQNVILTSRERDIVNRVPEIGANLVRNIPRLEAVAEAIYYMNKNFNGTGFPVDSLKGEEIPLAGRILRVVGDYLNVLSVKGTPRAAVADMETRTTWYDLEVVRALGQVLKDADPPDSTGEVEYLNLRDLRMGYTLAEEVTTIDGLLVAPKGMCLGMSHLEKLRNFSRLSGIQEPLAVIRS